MFGGGVVFWRTGVVFVCMVVSSRGCNGLVFCSSFLCWGVAASVNECRKGSDASPFCGVCEKCFPVFLETGLSLIFCELGFCCYVVWVCRAAGFVFLALTNGGFCLFKCWALTHG